MTWEYIRKSIDGKSVLLHRKIIEEKLGRKLLPHEVVHHINGNKTDNKVKNLRLMDKKDHTKLHHKISEIINIFCCNCNKEIIIRKKFYEWRKIHGQKSFFCSRECVKEYFSNSDQDKFNKGRFIENERYKQLVIDGLKKGLTGYKIAKMNNLNHSTVYNHIKRLKD